MSQYSTIGVMVTTIARRVVSADDSITPGARDNDSGAAVGLEFAAPVDGFSFSFSPLNVSGAIEALERQLAGFAAAAGTVSNERAIGHFVAHGERSSGTAKDSGHRAMVCMRPER
jgi:hypothetical protein